MCILILKRAFSPSILTLGTGVERCGDILHGVILPGGGGSGVGW